jgi:hypothetical protein
MMKMTYGQAVLAAYVMKHGVPKPTLKGGTGMVTQQTVKGGAHYATHGRWYAVKQFVKGTSAVQVMV